MPSPCSSTSKRRTTQRGGTALCRTCTTWVSEAVYPSSSPAFFQTGTFRFGSALSFPTHTTRCWGCPRAASSLSPFLALRSTALQTPFPEVWPVACTWMTSSCGIERQLQLCLNKVHNWSVANGFKFSKSKTICMHFCHLRTLDPDPSLTMDGDPIKVVKEMRFLGLVFDTKLSFLLHIRALKARCLKALDVLKVLAATEWGADSTVLLQLYRALVRSKLDYGSIVYALMSNSWTPFTTRVCGCLSVSLERRPSRAST